MINYFFYYHIENKKHSLSRCIKDYYYDFEHNDFVISVSYEEGEVSVNIKHVHQLQNLYFALTGEELILE